MLTSAGRAFVIDRLTNAPDIAVFWDAIDPEVGAASGVGQLGRPDPAGQRDRGPQGRAQGADDGDDTWRIGSSRRPKP